MALTKDEVRHIAHLARLRLSDEEVGKFSNQLTDILGWIEMLNEVDTSGTVETSQVTGLQNVVRTDDVECGGLSSMRRAELALHDQDAKRTIRDELLSCSELPVERKQVRVPSVL